MRLIAAGDAKTSSIRHPMFRSRAPPHCRQATSGSWFIGEVGHERRSNSRSVYVHSAATRGSPHIAVPSPPHIPLACRAHQSECGWTAAARGRRKGGPASMDPHEKTRPTRPDAPRATAPATRTFGPQGPTLGDLSDAYLQDYQVRQFRSHSTARGRTSSTSPTTPAGASRRSSASPGRRLTWPVASSGSRRPARRRWSGGYSRSRRPFPTPWRGGGHAATPTARLSSTAMGSRSAAGARRGAPPVRRPGCRPASFTIVGVPAARNLIRASVPERVAMLLTGHKSRAIFDRYNIIHEQELLDAGDQLVEYLAQQDAGGARPPADLHGQRRRPAPRLAPPPRATRHRVRAAGGGGGRTPPACSPRLAHRPNRYEPASDRGTRGNRAGRRART